MAGESVEQGGGEAPWGTNGFEFVEFIILEPGGDEEGFAGFDRDRGGVDFVLLLELAASRTAFTAVAGFVFTFEVDIDDHDDRA